MKSFAVTVHLVENKMRAYSSLFPIIAGVYTILIEAEDYSSVMKELSLGEDCMKVEISPIYKK